MIRIRIYPAETKSMLKEKFKELQDKLLEEIKSFYKDRLVSFVVFGSVARETYRHNSDIDLLIIAEGLPKGRMKRVEEFEAVEEKIEPFFNLSKKGRDRHLHLRDFQDS